MSKNSQKTNTLTERVDLVTMSCIVCRGGISVQETATDLGGGLRAHIVCGNPWRIAEELESLRARHLRTLIERDRYQVTAEERVSLRDEFARELGVEALHGDEQFRVGLERLRAWKAAANG